MADYRDRDDSWRDIVAPGIPEIQRVGINPETNSITPASDTSGLYAIYGRKNPYSARAARLGAMSGIDMGGRLGQLPGIAATFLAGKAEKEAEGFEKTRENDIKLLMARKEKWDEIKNDRDARDYNAEKVKEAISVGQEAYFAAINAGKFDEAPDFAKNAINDFATQNKVAMSPVENIHFWKGGDVSLVHSEEGGGTIILVKKGDNIAWKDGDKYKPVPKDSIGFGDLAAKMRADKTNQPKPMSARDYAASLTSQLNNLRNITTRRALTANEQRQYEAAEKKLNEITNTKQDPATYWEPGTNPPPGKFVKAQAAAPRTSPSSSPSAQRAVGRMVGGQPSAQPMPQGQPQQDPRRAKAEEILRANKLVVNEDTLAKVMRQL